MFFLVHPLVVALFDFGPKKQTRVFLANDDISQVLLKKKKTFPITFGIYHYISVERHYKPLNQVYLNTLYSRKLLLPRFYFFQTILCKTLVMVVFCVL